MNLVLRYLGKMEEKRGNKQQHQKNQDDHNYTAKLWNRICNNYLKYILKQWIVFFAPCDWLLKLEISSGIHLLFATAINEDISQINEEESRRRRRNSV